MPNRASFEHHDVGETRTDRAFDSTAAVSTVNFASLVKSVLMPNFARWAEFRAGPEIPPDDREDYERGLDAITNYVFETMFLDQKHHTWSPALCEIHDFCSRFGDMYCASSLAREKTSSLYRDEIPSRSP